MRANDAISTSGALERWTPASRLLAAGGRFVKPHRRQHLEAIGRLAGGVAHDINNLLTAIVLNSDVLAERVTERQLSALAETTRMSAERAGDLIRDLLAFVREQQQPPRLTNVNAAIASLAPLLRRTLGEHIDLQILAEAGKATVMLDPAQFESTVLNLALNARDAMPRGGRLVIQTSNMASKSAHTGWHRSGAAPGMVVIAVCDEGTGMPPDVAARAIEPFFTTKAGGVGTGLGLSMVETYARKAGGRLTIDSRAGAGTTVTLFLPVATAEMAQSPQSDGRQPRLYGRESILLVEDDRIVRAHVEVALGDLGYQVCGVADSIAALTLVTGGHVFDLLLTDVIIPGGMNGAELAVTLRRRWPQLNVLYTSAYAVSPTMVTRLASEPRSAFLAKPFRRHLLAAAVRALLDDAPAASGT